MLKFDKSKIRGIGDTIDVQEFKQHTETEAVLQAQCEQYLQYHPDIAVIRIPDAAYRAIFANHHVSGHIKGLISRFLKGLPDLILLQKNDRYASALCIELKKKGGKQTQGQKKFAMTVPVFICRSFKDFERVFKDWRD